MNEVKTKDFRANLAAYLDRVEEGEQFSLRGGKIIVLSADDFAAWLEWLSHPLVKDPT